MAIIDFGLDPVLSFQYRVVFLPAAVTNIGKSSVAKPSPMGGLMATGADALVAAANLVLGFNQISEVSLETEVETYREGGQNNLLHSFPNGTSAGSITLSHGLSRTSVAALLNNLIAGSDGSDFHEGQFALIIAYFQKMPIPFTGYALPLPTFWYFTDVWPSKIEIASAGGSSSEVLIESLTLTVKKAELDFIKLGNSFSTIKSLVR
ncbi:MAG: phage tail protein [Campylobacterales bacterium]|nr:phage tail protein [Campylobacterales bacterium]